MSKHKTYNKIFSIYGSGKVFKYSLERGAVDYPTLISKAYEDRVIADGGVVESLGCFTAFATSLGAYQPPIALAATGIGEISFTANWKPFKGAKYYLLDVSTSPTFATFVYENEIVPAPTTSYVVIGLNSNTTYYYRVRASTTFDADYQAVLNYATTKGYTLPSSTQQVLQNQLVVDLKSAGIWSKLDTFAVFATDGDSDFALIDWKRLTDYTAINSPTFTANDGYEGNGTSSYINLNFNASTETIIDSLTFGVWSNTGTNGAVQSLIGAIANSGIGTQITSNLTTFQRMFVAGNSAATTIINTGLSANQDTELITLDSDGTTQVLRRNTTTLGSVNQSQGQYNGDVFALARNQNGTPNNYSSTELAMVFYSQQLTITEIGDFYTSFSTYKTAL